MLQQGEYFAPALYEAGFMSAAHSQDDIDRTLEAARAVFNTLYAVIKLPALQTGSADSMAQRQQGGGTAAVFLCVAGI